MTSELFGTLLLWLIVLAVIVTIGVYVLRWLYRRSTIETAFVRTGFLGEKVVIKGGALVIPVLHELTPVNMNVIRISVQRSNERALVAKNRMRMDVNAEFFVRVGSEPQMVSAAAQTLGSRTMMEGGLTALLEGKFASALRTVAAQMPFEELHEKRHELALRVRELAAEALVSSGLEIESVAIVDLDQTPLEFFNPSNSFDAEGLTQLTETIEMRRKLRNEIEQRTLVDIRNQNLETHRRVLEIERDSEYAQLEQEAEIEVRRATQRTALARERALREQETEEARLQASEAVEKARIAQERSLTEERIRKEEEAQRLELGRRRAFDETEITMRELTERQGIDTEIKLEEARSAREQNQRALEVARRKALELAEEDRKIALEQKAAELSRAEAERRRAELEAQQQTDAARIALDRKLDELRIERERGMDGLQIAKRQAFEEAEIASNEEIERARVTAERGVEEARLIRDRELRELAIQNALQIETAELRKAIEVAKQSQERYAALAATEAVRGKAVAAEEQVLTAREREMAERRKATDLIAAQRDAQREALQMTARADAEMAVARSLAEARKITALASAEADRTMAEAALRRYEVDATGARQLNEAENMLSNDARTGRLRSALLDRIEGIVRESVKPMEKIEGIHILHVDGLNGGGEGGGRRNATDEVIDSALRYRMQAPMIDSLMKDIGIDGGSIGGMSNVLRDAKDMSSLTARKAAETAGAKDGNAAASAGLPPEVDTDTDNDRDD
ncbi:MAG: flotillin domain-containing protein [Pararhodobacter sp.]